MTPALSVLAPCLNEAPNVPSLCERVLSALESAAIMKRGGGELILIDDGSTDGTANLALTLEPRVNLARHPERRGIPAAWRTGLEFARGTHVCTLDADLQYRPEEIANLWDALDAAGADFAQGVRQFDGGTDLVRLALSRGLNRLLNTAFRTNARDHKSGFLLCRREVLASLLEPASRFRHWQCFVGVAARTRGLACVEVDVSFDRRSRG